MYRYSGKYDSTAMRDSNFYYRRWCCYLNFLCFGVLAIILKNIKSNYLRVFKTGGCWLGLGLPCKCLYENTCLSSIVGTTAVSGSAFSHLEGDINRFQRMGSIDSFNQVKYNFLKLKKIYITLRIKLILSPCQ